MYCVLDRSRRLCLPLDIQMQLVDALVVPILLYGCEVWGFQNMDIVERIHLEFINLVLGVNKSPTPIWCTVNWAEFH